MNAPLDRGADVVTTAARHADDVDRNGRFPIEAVRALKDARLLSLLIPVEFGGGGASLFDVAEICTSLGQRCASTAMIFAMHQIKVSSLVAHGRGSAWHEDFMRRLCDEQLLLGSATTEGGIGGNMRNSICAFERDGATFRIASDALSRAQSFVRKDARRHPNGPAPGALRLAEATAKLQLMRSNIVEGLKRFAKAQQNEDDLNSMSFAVAMNNIKIGSSQLSIEIINHALLIAGIAGYKNDTPFSVGRHMRDALSAQVMISNDRIFTNLSNMLLAQRIDQRLGE